MRKVIINPQFFYNPYPAYAYIYARDNGIKDWTEVEPVIATNAEVSYLYARFVIQKRFKIGEKIIKGTIFQHSYEFFLECKL